MRRLEQLESELTVAREVLTDAEGMYEVIQRQVDVYTEVIADQELHGVKTESVTSDVLHDEMDGILKAQGSPLHRKIIYERLIAAGIEVAGADPVANTGAHLSSDDRFVSFGDGKWGLAEWRPQANGNGTFSNGAHENETPLPSNFSVGDMVRVLDDSDAAEKYQGLEGTISGHSTPINNEGAWRWVSFDDLEAGKVYQINEDWLELAGPADDNIDDLPF